MATARLPIFWSGCSFRTCPSTMSTTRNAKVEAVTRDDVARVAARLLRADDLRFVVVGRPVGLMN